MGNTENLNQSGNKFFAYIKRHSDIVFGIFAALVLSALVAVFIFAFRKGVPPHAEDGNAFDTIYALEQSEEVIE